MLAQTYFAERTSPKDNRVMAENPWYANLPANRWIELEAGPNSPIGFRTDHAGAVYVPERNSVFLFGSDSHLRNFDNGLLELQLDDMRWHLPYVPSPRYAMRTDKQGRRISGVARLLPWPMHIYDAMVYDQRNRERGQYAEDRTHGQVTEHVEPAVVLGEILGQAIQHWYLSR